MYLLAFFCCKKFSLENIYFINCKFFIILILLPIDIFLNYKIIFDNLKIYSYKKNILTFQFKNYFIYNNLIYYNIYIYKKINKFDKLFIFISDYGFILNNLFNLNYLILNFHISLLPKYRGQNPLILIIFYFNKFLGFNIISLSKKIDIGNIFYLYKFFYKFNLNFNIIKYNFSLNSSFFFINFFKKIFYIYFYFIKQSRNYEFFIFLTK